MDFAQAISSSVPQPAIERSVLSGATASTGARSSSNANFAASLAASDAAITVERAEAMVGERIRAPEGGCGCDAFVTAVAPPTANMARPVADRAVFGANVGLGPALSPGSPVLIEPQLPTTANAPADEVNQPDHRHQAIIRNATELITTNSSGVVEVLAIPWGRVTRR